MYERFLYSYSLTMFINKMDSWVFFKLNNVVEWGNGSKQKIPVYSNNQRYRKINNWHCLPICSGLILYKRKNIFEINCWEYCQYYQTLLDATDHFIAYNSYTLMYTEKWGKHVHLFPSPVLDILGNTPRNSLFLGVVHLYDCGNSQKCANPSNARGWWCQWTGTMGKHSIVRRKCDDASTCGKSSLFFHA